MKEVYVLYMIRNKQGFLGGVFTTREKAESAYHTIIKETPNFYNGFKINRTYIDEIY